MRERLVPEATKNRGLSLLCTIEVPLTLGVDRGRFCATEGLQRVLSDFWERLRRASSNEEEVVPWWRLQWNEGVAEILKPLQPTNQN